MKSSRILTFAFAATTLLACGKSDPGSVGDDGTPDSMLPAPTNGFQLVSPDLTIPAGSEHTFCWYFQTPNTAEVDVTKWSSFMETGSHHLILYLTQGPTSGHPVGEAPSEAGCGGGISDTWTYSSQTAGEIITLQLPTDDGAGKPLAQKIPAGQYGYIQMHYSNKNDTDIVAHVTVNADGLATGTAYTPTAAFVTYVSGFKIPATANTMANAYKVTNNCPVPAGRKFWLMSSHTHKQGVHTNVLDNATQQMVFDSADWEHPLAKEWNTGAFQTFPNGFTGSCQYVNTTGHEIVEGQSAVTNEMCMTPGYMFPATNPALCVAFGDAGGQGQLINQ
jgi:hypothetical protein